MMSNVQINNKIKMMRNILKSKMRQTSLFLLLKKKKKTIAMNKKMNISIIISNRINHSYAKIISNNNNQILIKLIINNLTNLKTKWRMRQSKYIYNKRIYRSQIKLKKLEKYYNRS